MLLENGRSSRTSIFLSKENVEWLLRSFKEFFWVKRGKTWDRSRHGSQQSLCMVLGWDNIGWYLGF